MLYNYLKVGWLLFTDFDVRRVISLPSFMVVSALVSELCKSKQIKDKKKNSISNLTPFLGI